jgi:DNA-binding FadR family transcriptional regulator
MKKSYHKHLDPMFQKTTHNRVYQDLVNQIQDAIIDGKLKAGDRLPPQRQLVQMFQTSRASLREALRVLEQKGLIEIKLGMSGGAVVKEVNTEQVTDNLAILIRSQKVSLGELTEFRERAEAEVASLAAEKATKRDIQRLHKLLEEAKSCYETGVSNWDEFNRADRELHLAIAEVAKNTVYEFVLRMIHNNIHNYYRRLSLKSENIMKENYQDLCNIVRALEKRESTKARDLVQRHVRKFSRKMLRKQEEMNKHLRNES